jgi:tetratricopeptide (TPR) repeat protein
MGKTDELRRRLEMAAAREDLPLQTRARLASYWITSFGDTAQAAKLIDGGLSPTPTAEDLYSAGSQLYGGGAYALASVYFQRAYDADPNDGQAIGALLQSYENSGQISKAIDALQDWVNRHPQDRSAKQRLDQMRARVAGDTTAQKPAF